MRSIYFTVDDVKDLLGVSKGHAYKVIQKLNKELVELHYIVVAGKVPRKYFSDRFYGGVMDYVGER